MGREGHQSEPGLRLDLDAEGGFRDRLGGRRLGMGSVLRGHRDKETRPHPRALTVGEMSSPWVISVHGRRNCTLGLLLMRPRWSEKGQAAF